MGIRAALSTGGSTGRIQPVNYTPADGDWAYCIGSDKPGIFALLKDGESWSISQTADFDTMEVLRLEGRTRAPEKTPQLIRVTSPISTGAFTVTINTIPFTYNADTAGLLVGSGAVASIDDITGSLVTVSGLTGMTANSVGRQLVVSGAASAPNNGTFPIDAFIDSTTVLIRNSAGVAPDANNGSISWEERRRPDNDTTVATGLQDLINAGGEPVSARALADGVLQIDEDDLDDQNTFGVTGNMTLHEVTWTVQMLIDSAVRASQAITAKGRVRDRMDLGTLLTNLSAGDHTLEFKLIVGTEPTLSSLHFEGEVPAVYLDALVTT